MSKPLEIFIWFGIFASVAYLFPKLFWFFWVLSSLFYTVFSYFCVVGFSRSVILEVSATMSALCFALVVVFFYKKFFSS